MPVHQDINNRVKNNGASNPNWKNSLATIERAAPVATIQPSTKETYVEYIWICVCYAKG